VHGTSKRCERHLFTEGHAVPAVDVGPLDLDLAGCGKRPVGTAPLRSRLGKPLQMQGNTSEPRAFSKRFLAFFRSLPGVFKGSIGGHPRNINLVMAAPHQR
jgi:hypothetical protein